MLRVVPETVVVVDDDDAIRDALSDLLAMDGFDVLTARDGGEAIDVLEKAPRPCVAIVDLVMPRVDGWHLVRALTGKPAGRGVGIVCCTAGRSDAPAGCSAVLRKPFDGEALVAAVALALGHARSSLTAAE